MRYSQIAAKYARALLNVAVELEKTEEYGDILAVVVQLYQKAKQFFDDPTIGAAEHVDRITKFINQIGAHFDKPFWNFLKIVFEKRRQSVLPAILQYYKNMKIESEMKVPVFLTTAYELSEEELKVITDFVRKYTKRNPVFETRIDESLIAGVVIECEGKTFDASVAGRIRNVTRHVLQREVM
ncbi:MULTISPECIES: F0F1 ATP synthase subunit delta [Pseudothermotoga]|jgi:F-type H+-transporting ATPase subunit delta|uniref:ATP synthase subunit delta n=1 Tax=Pseudothermotoga lettingae (strain ATCC BAA-301 / DSM 14385 / NBRC 107922 / TMO) TaxID=416591 RepID=ATPD_PSELT|nr:MULTISPECIES: F0F1 ATP synthase subunit delta [Pseudothermotoga]A8F3J9.1 RecName: Full=ATP synthase subunit delta; AltName: Full=ATP synthase F(1) sector subunit delta; AltName: Full=F-type ATPase subunit delta; Short=F-ATPase subunit delta [Pseudothermotoga lettingae TMO]ABV32733.1 ATP synthase F1, delta subunit [Pseudothermotoga lettingae TMO]KUK20660.1 MAG: ATP synthase subunit delta [Pseudothermotoga lettingae]MDI3495934.1 F-type H+-transporting ATPase subunit delta [Pseudothermotoga sp.